MENSLDGNDFNMKIELTKKQQQVLNAAIDWYNHSSEQVFQFAGNPGTGKSVLMNEIIKGLGVDINRVAPMAYVGSAAINMRLKGLLNAKTIHSSIYEFIETPLLDKNGDIVMNPYFNRPEKQYRRITKDLDDIDLIVIDEGGTVPLNMKKDILSRGKKIIVAGDLDQLSPVADQPAFLVEGKIYVLDEIMRQAQNSAIIYLMQRAKRGLPIHTGLYGNEVLVIEEKDFNYIKDKALLTAGVILCGRNATREKYTNIIRNEILHKDSILPDSGEKLICRANDWTFAAGGINLTNGLTGIVMNKPDVSTFDGKCFMIDFLPDLNPIPFNNVPVDYKYFTSDPERKRDMKNYNYLSGEAFEFGYVITVHVAQGSQWKTGIYFEEYLPSNNEKLHYTALSRFQNKCIYVKRNRKYF